MAANTISEWESVEVTNDPRWAAVKKVVGSTCFVRAAFLSDFLLYIAGQELSFASTEAIYPVDRRSTRRVCSKR